MEKKGSPLLVLLLLILSGLVNSSTAYLSKSKMSVGALPTDDSYKINTEVYNAIVKSIESLNQEIANHERQKKAAEKDKANRKQEQLNLKKQCEELNKIEKDDTTKTQSDTTQATQKRCEELPKRLKELDKLIERSESVVASEISSCKRLNTQIDSLEKKLDAEVQRIQFSLKRISGSVKIDFRGTLYYAFIANTDSNKIQLHWKRKDGSKFLSLGNVLSYLQSKKENVLMITNAGMYTPNFEPQGLFIDGHRNKLRPLDTNNPKTDANFYLRPNGVFFVDTFGKSHIEATENFQKLDTSKQNIIEFATQSGPMLLYDGKINDKFSQGSSNRKIRSGVGQINSTNSVFAISKDDANFFDFALLFKDVFGCKDALFLDGAISMMYLKDIDSTSIGGQFGPLISITSITQKK